MYIDCDSDYFPVKFLEGVSAKYPHSPRVIRNGDDVRVGAAGRHLDQEPSP